MKKATSSTSPPAACTISTTACGAALQDEGLGAGALAHARPHSFTCTPDQGGVKTGCVRCFSYGGRRCIRHPHAHGSPHHRATYTGLGNKRRGASDPLCTRIVVSSIHRLQAYARPWAALACLCRTQSGGWVCVHARAWLVGVRRYCVRHKRACAHSDARVGS